MVFAGIDLGTSGIKVVLVDAGGLVLASAARPVEVQIPKPGWSEQDPSDWWRITCDLFDELAAKAPQHMRGLRAIALSGQMLGSVLVDAQDQPVAPCILWNDQRATEECAELAARVPDIAMRVNGLPDPGFTAPKLMWMAKHAPEALARAEALMLPKDYVRLHLTGARGIEETDAAGTMLLGCADGQWQDDILAAAGWDRARLPPILQSCAVAGQLRADLCQRWGAPSDVAVAAGCGDNYAGALGVGVAAPGRAVVSIGTSGNLCTVATAYRPAPQNALLSTPHAVPGQFMSMGVVLAATQALDWLARLTGTQAAELAQMAETRAQRGVADCPVSRPTLTGVRSPDNRPDASGFVGGLTAGHDKSDLAYAIMEGVAMQFHAVYLAQRDVGVMADMIVAVGGGAQSHFWLQLIASLMEVEIAVPEAAELAAPLGAARIAQAAVMPDQADQILSALPNMTGTVAPDPNLSRVLQDRYLAHRALPFTCG